MTKKMKTSRNKQFCAAILTDLSKAYGFDKKAIKLLPNVGIRKLKSVLSFRSELDIFDGVPKGSILDPLFNINICTLFSVHITYDIVIFLHTLLTTPLLTNEINTAMI